MILKAARFTRQIGKDYADDGQQGRGMYRVGVPVRGDMRPRETRT
jgi:hypothetical protein